MSQPKPFPPEERAKIVEALKAKTLSIEEAVKTTGRAEKTVRSWLSPANKSKTPPKPPTAKEPSEVQQLRAEVQRLQKMMLEFLLEERKTRSA